MAFDLTQTQFDSVRALNAGTDYFESDDIPELTSEQLSKYCPLYNEAERAILRGNPTNFQRSQVLRSAMLRLKREPKQDA